MVLLEAFLSDWLGECGPRSTVFVFSSRLKERVLTFAANVEAVIEVIFVHLSFVPPTKRHDVAMLGKLSCEPPGWSCLGGEGAN